MTPDKCSLLLKNLTLATKYLDTTAHIDGILKSIRCYDATIL
jgi:hypothetical protein